MQSSLLSFIGIASAGVALLVMLRVLTIEHLVQNVKRGIGAIAAFVVLGVVLQLLLPSALTQSFVQLVGSSLVLAVGFLVFALALVLIATYVTGTRKGRNN